MKVVIDRFEGNFAVCEKDNGEMISIERDKLPSVAKEGDALVIEQDNIYIDKDETEKRKNEIEKLMDDLWE
jgi:hypothetical protein